MPLKDGVEVIKEIMQFIDTLSTVYAVERPLFILVTAYYSD